MSQISLREYDAKRLMADVLWTVYQWVLVETEQQLEEVVSVLENIIPSWLRVVKPDQLFGKRGKYGLVWVKLSPSEVHVWIRDRRQQEQTLAGVTDRLHTFLIEPFISHEGELYLAFHTERDAEVIRFSSCGGVDIEEQWESVREVSVDVLEELSDGLLTELVIWESRTDEIKIFISQLFHFFRTQGFTSLEINPFVFTAKWNIHCLDMVAKVDSCEWWKQVKRKQYVTRVKHFWTHIHPSEVIVESLDEKTWASLKLTIINPEGHLWFLLWWWGASVLVMDTMSKRWLLHEVANYGELSGNPDEESNGAYVTTLIETMLANGKSWQYLCLIWWIANFTDIVALVKPLCRVLKTYADELRERQVTILMRRGWLRVEQAMRLLKTTCTTLWLPCVIHDDEHYLTEIFDEVKL